MKFLDKAYNDMVVQELQTIDISGATVLDNKIVNSQQFSIENNSKQNINAYVTSYSGTLIQMHQEGSLSARFDYENAQNNMNNFNNEANHVHAQSQNLQSILSPHGSGGVATPCKVHIYPPKTLLASQPSGKTMGQHLLYALQV